MSKIEWTEKTWNPVTGCTKISPGCKHCYAETLSKRLKAMGVNGYENGFDISLMNDRLDQPLRRKKPTMYFVNSMSDLFQEDVPFAYVEKVVDVIKKTHWHTYQILTKRADRMAEFFRSRSVPDNAWLGVSVEDKRYGIPRIASLSKINAKTKFLSIEPLLEDLGEIDLIEINWAIVGGESGANARPMEKIWAIKIRKQCELNGVGFFFKQWGTWGGDGVKRNKSANGRILNGKTWDMMPKYK